MYRLRRRRAGGGGGHGSRPLLSSASSTSSSHRQNSSTLSDSSSSCATDSTSSSGFRRHRLRHPQMGLFRAGSGWFSRSDGGCTSGSEMSCDTVIFMGGEAASAGYCTDWERPPTCVNPVASIENVRTPTNNNTHASLAAKFENALKMPHLTKRECLTETETEMDDCSASVVGLTRAHSTQGTSCLTGEGLSQDRRPLHSSAWSFHSCNVDTQASGSMHNRRRPPRTNARVWPRISARDVIETLSTQKEQWVDGPKAVYRANFRDCEFLPSEPIVFKPAAPLLKPQEASPPTEATNNNKNEPTPVERNSQSESEGSSGSCSSCSYSSDSDEDPLPPPPEMPSSSSPPPLPPVEAIRQTASILPKNVTMSTPTIVTPTATQRSMEDPPRISQPVEESCQHDSSTYSTIDRKNNRVLSDISERSGEGGSVAGVGLGALGPLGGNQTDVDDDDEELLGTVDFCVAGVGAPHMVTGCRRLEDVELPPLPCAVSWSEHPFMPTTTTTITTNATVATSAAIATQFPSSLDTESRLAHKSQEMLAHDEHNQSVMNSSHSPTPPVPDKPRPGKMSNQSTPILEGRKLRESLPQVPHGEPMNTDLARVRQWVDKMSSAPQSPKPHRISNGEERGGGSGGRRSHLGTSEVSSVLSGSNPSSASPQIQREAAPCPPPTVTQTANSTAPVAPISTTPTTSTTPFISPLNFPPPPPHFTPERWHQWIMMVQMFLGAPMPPPVSSLVSQPSTAEPNSQYQPPSWMQFPYMFPSFDPSVYLSSMYPTPFTAAPASTPGSHPPQGMSPKHGSSSVVMGATSATECPPTQAPPVPQRSQSRDVAESVVSQPAPPVYPSDAIANSRHFHLPMDLAELVAAEKRLKKKGKSTDCGGRWLFGLSKSRRKSSEHESYPTKAGYPPTSYEYPGHMPQTTSWTPGIPPPNHQSQHASQAGFPLHLISPYSVVTAPVPPNRYRACRSMVTAPISGSHHGSPVPIDANSASSALFGVHDSPSRYYLGNPGVPLAPGPGGRKPGGSRSVVSQPTGPSMSSHHPLAYPGSFASQQLQQQQPSGGYPFLMFNPNNMAQPQLANITKSSAVPAPQHVHSSQRAHGSSGYESMVAARDNSEVSSCANSDQSSSVAPAPPPPRRGASVVSGGPSTEEIQQQKSRRPRKSRNRADQTSSRRDHRSGVRASSLPPTESGSDFVNAPSLPVSRPSHSSKRTAPSKEVRQSSGQGSDGTPTPTNVSTVTLQHHNAGEKQPPQRRMLLTEMMEKQIRQEKIAQLIYEQELLKQELNKVLALMPNEVRPNFTDFQRVLKSHPMEDPGFIRALERETQAIREWINACKSRFMLVTTFDAKPLSSNSTSVNMGESLSLHQFASPMASRPLQHHKPPTNSNMEIVSSSSAARKIFSTGQRNYKQSS